MDKRRSPIVPPFARSCRAGPARYSPLAMAGPSRGALGGLVRTMRPRQWVKNLFVLTPLVFAKELFSPMVALRALGGFVTFCLLASAVYFVNDLVDVLADRAHPVKQNRPIASGVLPTGAAKRIAVVLVVVALGGSVTLGWAFAACALTYLALNLAYSLKLKRIAYLDVLCIALGFELRVVSGSYAAQVPPSVYLLVVTFLLASFLGLGKRMHELNQGAGAEKQRAALKAYHPRALSVLLYVTAAATLATYVLYTLDPGTRSMFGTDYLIATAAFSVFGVLRFVQLVGRSVTSESPTEEMLRDKPFLVNLALWAVSIVAVIYLS